MADVHGAGNAIPGGLHLPVLAGFQIERKFVILIDGNNEAFHRQSHFHGHHPAHHIAKVTGRDAEDHIVIR